MTANILASAPSSVATIRRSFPILLLLALATTAQGAYIDNFVAVEDSNDWPLQVFGPHTTDDSNSETLPGVWGGTRETFLEIVGGQGDVTVNLETNFGGYLDSLAGVEAIYELTVGYGGAPIADRNQPITLDFRAIDYGSDPDNTFDVTLTLYDGLTTAGQTLAMSGSNFLPSDPSQQLAFNLAHAAFNGIAFDGTTDIALSFLFELTEGLDFQIGSIQLGVFDQNQDPNPIPEPGTWALGLLALLGLAACIHRRRK